MKGTSLNLTSMSLKSVYFNFQYVPYACRHILSCSVVPKRSSASRAQFFFSAASCSVEVSTRKNKCCLVIENLYAEKTGPPVFLTKMTSGPYVACICTFKCEYAFHAYYQICASAPPDLRVCSYTHGRRIYTK